ncbi:hypothetical protein EON65_26245 [archaeon]|nr:MAG: hypothetical protein EON65_26245 [archaeon]
MSSFSQKNLLFETLSWLDGLSLPPPPSSSQTTKLASSNSLTLIKPDISRDLLFKVRPFYLADDYEDMLPSWTDTLYANQTLLMFGFKRWHRYSLKRARRVAYESQILARLPSWRAFVYSARAMDRWKTFSLKHRYLRLQIHAKAKTLKKHLKIKRMVRFWKLWTRRRMRLRRVCFLSWQLHVRRVMKVGKTRQ